MYTKNLASNNLWHYLKIMWKGFKQIKFPNLNKLSSKKFRTGVTAQINNKMNEIVLTWTLKKGPMICTVVSSSGCGCAWLCSGSLITLPVTRCNSRTFWPPLPMMRPTWELGTSISTVSRTSSLAATKPSSRIFSNIRYCA